MRSNHLGFPYSALPSSSIVIFTDPLIESLMIMQYENCSLTCYSKLLSGSEQALFLLEQYQFSDTIQQSDSEISIGRNLTGASLGPAGKIVATTRTR